MASSASTEQWIFTGGSFSSFTMSVFLILAASSTVLPLSHSVGRLDAANGVPAARAPHQPGTHARDVLAEGPDVARVVVVVNDLVTVCHRLSPLYSAFHLIDFRSTPSL